MIRIMYGVPLKMEHWVSKEVKNTYKNDCCEDFFLRNGPYLYCGMCGSKMGQRETTYKLTPLFEEFIHCSDEFFEDLDIDDPTGWNAFPGDDYVVNGLDIAEESDIVGAKKWTKMTRIIGVRLNDESSINTQCLAQPNHDFIVKCLRELNIDDDNLQYYIVQ